MKKTSVEEPTAYAEIGTYLHRDNSKAKVKSYVSCNEPLKVDSAMDTKQIQKLRVEVHVKEDTSVKGNQFYEKDVETLQISNGGESQPTTETSSNEMPNPNVEPSDLGEDFKKWTKNIIDKLKDSEVIQYALITAVGIVSALALGMAMVR